ncbi:MAG: DNA replication/repair protein RecF [Christensenellales bacterium]|jgi:DNA replication and repair protein RecF
MRILSVRLWQFRNYERLSLEAAKINIIEGDNAQGKTNLLEAVFMCCAGRSHRTARDRDLIMNGRQEALIRVDYERNGIHRIDIKLSAASKKRISEDGNALRKIGELMGRINCVMFAPEDLGLIKNGPSVRRRYMDIALSQVSPGYFYALQSYGRALIQRNLLLKGICYGKCDQETLPAWDEQLAVSGDAIIKERRAFVENISDMASEIHNAISGGEKLEISYVCGTGEAETAEALIQSRRTDIMRGATMRGAHRDDLKILINGMDSRVFASQGQQRTAALSLKLAELEYIKLITGNTPILLLDDVMSELDSKRRTALKSRFGGAQVFLTGTGADMNAEEFLAGAKRFLVKSGSIIPAERHGKV